MFEALFRQFFGMSGNTNDFSNCALQETARKQILLTELDSEIQKLIEHYHITEEKRGQSGTTTLSEIGAVVYRARRRADAYSKVLNELGSGKLRSLSWKHADIERFLAASPLSENELGEIISAEFPESWYSLKDIKAKLQGVYDRYGLDRTAKATDLEQYIPCCKKKGYGADYSRINGYQFQRPQDNN